MSATEPLTEASKRDRLEAYLRARVGDGEFYFKSRYVADEVGLSPKEIGAIMVELAEDAEEIDISRWSYTNATTWRVRPA